MYYYYLHFTGEDSEAQGDYITHPGATEILWDQDSPTPKHIMLTSVLFYLRIRNYFIAVTSQKLPKCNTDLNVKCRTIKFLKNNISKNLHDLGYGDDFLGTTQKARSMKKTDKLDLIKIKNCFMKVNVQRMRRQATNWEKNI